MFDLQAVIGRPCTICRIVTVAVTMSILSIFHDHGVEESDFFGLRHYGGVHVPPAADVFMAFAQACTIWIVCERVIVDRLVRRRPAKGG